MNWKRVIAKEWLIIITLTISLPLAGYGLFLYQNSLYEKEQATIKAFNPSRAEIDAYLKSKTQQRLSKMSLEELQALKAQRMQQKNTEHLQVEFDPDAYLQELRQQAKQRAQAKDEMLAKLIHEQRSSPSVEDNFTISLFLIPFLYLCLAILRITYWSVKTVRRRQLSIQTNSSYQLPPTAIATDSFC